MNQILYDKISKRTNCAACKGKNFGRWLDLGMQPLANALVKDINNIEEDLFPLKVIYCKDCELVQLEYIVKPEVLFGNYLYYSSTSEAFRKHFELLAQEQFNLDLIKKGELVVDIGSNDGILLAPFKRLGATILGIEPAAAIANKAAKDGIETWAEYFTPDTAKRIVKGFGKAKLVTMTNVFAHVPDLDQIVEGVKELLAPDGRFMVEVAYLPEMLKKGTFDLIYHEHMYYWHLFPMWKFFYKHNMKIENVEQTSVHGGSIRVTVVNEEPEGWAMLKDADLTKDRLFREFPKKVIDNRNEIVSLITKFKKQKKRIIGYGAPAKMSTMTNYFDLGPEQIDYIIDDAPAKQGLYSPRKHIKIVPPYTDLSKCTHDYIFLFAWNFKDSLMSLIKARGYKGKFIIPFPKVTIL